MKHLKLFEAFLNEGRKPTVEVSVRYAGVAGDAFRDAYSKMGKMTSTNTFQFKNAEDAEEFEGYLIDYIDIPEDEIERHNYGLDESVEDSLSEGTLDQGEIAIYIGNEGTTHIFKRGKGYYGYNDEFDFEAKDKKELEKKLKMWRYELLAGSID